MLSGMDFVQRINLQVKKTGFTAVRQPPLRDGYNDIALLSLTDQNARRHYPGIRVIAKADQKPRGWKDRDVYRMLSLANYAAETGTEALVVTSRDLTTDQVAIIPVDEALTEAVIEIEAQLASRAARPGPEGQRADQELHWWRREHSHILQRPAEETPRPIHDDKQEWNTMQELRSEEQINNAVAELGTSSNAGVRAGVIEAFTGGPSTCEKCDEVLRMSRGRRIKARYNTPDHMVECTECQALYLVHEGKPKKSTAMAWNIPDTVQTLRHESVAELWPGAEKIPESCLEEHEGQFDCEYSHDWHGKQMVLALPQVLTYAWDADVPVLVTCDDSKPQDIDALYDTNADAPEAPFRLNPEWYLVRSNSQVINNLINTLDQLDMEDPDADRLRSVVSAMIEFASA